jgi:hypothetical protein
VSPSLAAPLQQGALSIAFSTDTATITPGGSITLNATITSPVTDTLALTTNIGGFAGWSANVNPLPPITITPDVPINVVFTLTAPTDATGSIDFQANINGPAAGAAFDTITVNVDEPGTISLRIELREGTNPRDVTPGSNVTYQLRVVNNGEEQVDVALDFGPEICDQAAPGCSEVFSQSPNINDLEPNASREIDVVVSLPDNAPIGATALTRVVARVVDPADANVEAQLLLQTNVIESSPTPTATNTNTPEPTDTPTPSVTPTLGPICSDIFENDDDQGSAVEIQVNLPQPPLVRDPDVDDRRAICPAGDEDWLYFGAIEDKVYTINVSDVAPGLDLTLELFDEDGNLLEFNDDFFERDPAAPNPNDINPRIQQWRAPATGLYYIRVRDAVGGGGLDRTYRIELIAQGTGPTPATVAEICSDDFEEDGLPEQARLIGPNERQFDRRLCPTGDADWVTFFGSEDKRYFLYTDTRPYFQNNPVNDTIEVEAGADTVIVLTDRDGVSVIDVNDDIPGGESLDSQIEFVPNVDGFYFLQVKNVGDLGNQFIRYDLTLELCVPGTNNCGREIFAAPASNPAPAPVPTDTPQPESTPTEEFSLDETATPEADTTPEAQ